MSSAEFYTHAAWRVKPGNEEAFVAAWRELATAFAGLDAHPLWGTLLRSEDDPRTFYSFGPWRRREDIEAMRADPAARAAIARVVELCERATPESCRRIEHVEP